ncbi:hypothetical protein ACFS27_14110 [Promicromonospora vindobonensis]|uniref:Uncharacterized protein n=1 Tax=Promicromonospora vindobonensis TaxID=195748 RepID=A0ABW5VSK9_9MICO
MRGSRAVRTAGWVLAVPFLLFIVLPIAVLSAPVVLVLSIVVSVVHLLQARRHARLLLPVCRVPGVVPSSESSMGMTYEAAALADRPVILAAVSAGPAQLGEPWADDRTVQVHGITWDGLLRALSIDVYVLANGALSWGVSVDDEGFPVTDHDQEGETLAAVPGVRDVVRQDREVFDWVTDEARPVDEMLADFLRAVSAPSSPSGETGDR